MQEAMEIAWIREQWDPYNIEEIVELRLNKYLDYEEWETFILQKKDEKEKNFDNYNRAIKSKLREFIQADKFDAYQKNNKNLRKFISDSV